MFLNVCFIGFGGDCSMKLDTLKDVQLLARGLDQIISESILDAKCKSVNYYFGSLIDKGELPGGHLAAGIKRKSMDLTRKLAKMRRGD